MINDFDRAKVGYDKMIAHGQAVWNAAIEAAAKAAEECGDYPASYYVEDIEKLKK